MKVVIADDSLLIREGLANLLKRSGVQVVGTAADAPALHREVALTQPDAALVDIKMPPSFSDEGIQAAQRLRHTHPSIGVLVLSQYMATEWALRLLQDEPAHLGYLLKDQIDDPVTLLDSLHRVVAGECVIDPTMVDSLLHRPREPGPLDSLSKRELQVLTMMAEGRSNTGIANRLNVSIKTLEAHIRHILLRLGLEESSDDHRRVLAVLQYLRSTA